MHATDLVIERPWIAPVAWLVLHSLDYFLTLIGARIRLRGAHTVFKIDGSYELNPLFQKVIDRQRWLSARFIVTLVALALALYLLACISDDAEMADGLGFLLGVVVFTRIAVIGKHLHNIWLYLRMIKRPGSITGSVKYDRPTVYSITASTYLHFGVLLGAAAVIVPDPWILGGAAGNSFIALYSSILGWRAARTPPPPPLEASDAEDN